MNIGFLFLLAISHSIAMLASNLHMEAKRHFKYSEIKPTVQFARKHWSNPTIHEPWRGFEDKTPDKRLQLKAVRQQILYTATFFMERGETPTSIVPKLESMLLDKQTTRRGRS